MSRLSPTRVVRVFAVAVLALTAVLLVPSTARAATVLPGASTAHPFSDPVWWPLRTEVKFDCYRGNPGCTSPLYHTTWLMDPVSTDVSTTRAHEPVYAMGAGIAHYGVTKDVGCGHEQGRGNFLWIDHGNGVLSWYGHLAWPFSVPNGAYVTPRTQIALIGNSGYSNCRLYPRMHYIDIAVKHNAANGGINGDYFELHTLYACVNGVRQSWPQQVNTRWQKWNDVPKSPGLNLHIIPASDANHSCIPSQTATPDRTTNVHLTRSGAGTLRATWALPATGASRASTVVLISEYHPTIRRWLELRKHSLPGNRTVTIFTGLHPRHTFRVQVMFHNGVGFSAASSWASAVAG